MGVPWVQTVRKLHLAVIGLAICSFLLYLVYLTTPEPHTTVSPPILTTSEAHGNPNYTSPQPPRPILSLEVSAVPINTANVSSAPDLTKGVAAEVIYEEGHTDVSSSLCPGNGKDIKLVIVITSAPSHKDARMAIRLTWGHYAQRRDVAFLFILGTTSNTNLTISIKNEQYIYGDIIQGKFIDTYDNLTLKTISFLEWISTHCSEAKFVLKTDDDMFINVPQLFTFIKKRNPQTKAIYGRLAKKWKPIRNNKSKYYISLQQYRPAVFPDFTTGPAYLFPAQLAKPLYQAALNYTYFKLEDVFVTGIVANGLKIRRVHASEFFNKRVSMTPCNVQRAISIHMVKGSEQFDLWKKLLDGKCKQ